MKRQLIAELDRSQSGPVVLKGWIRRIRETKSTTFIVMQDCSGIVQVVANPADVKELGLRAESAVAITGTPRIDERAPGGFEIDCHSIEVLNPAAEVLPFTSTSRLEEISPEIAINHRPLALRTDRGGAIFRIEAALAEEFRAALRRRSFTEIFTSKIVASATEGGTNLFAIKYFDRAAYLAQSPQFYKEHAVAGMERVFETGHVYRAEPHASSRHLCEYLSLDLEIGFIDSLDDIIELEREVLTEVFAAIRSRYAHLLAQFDAYSPSLDEAPVWTFEECIDRLRNAHGRSDLTDDLDPMAERQLCELAKNETERRGGFRDGISAQQPSLLYASCARRYACGGIRFATARAGSYDRRPATASTIGSRSGTGCTRHRERDVRIASEGVRARNAAAWWARNRSGAADVSGARAQKYSRGRALSARSQSPGALKRKASLRRRSVRPRRSTLSAI